MVGVGARQTSIKQAMTLSRGQRGLRVMGAVQFLLSPMFVTFPTVVNLMKHWVFIHKASLFFA